MSDNIAQLAAIRNIAGEAALTEEEAGELERATLEQMFPSGVDASDHRANLAEHLDDNYLGTIAQDVHDWYEDDRDSNKEWYHRETYGMKLLGISTDPIPGASFSGASEVTHPLLAEAIVQFQSRAMAELWPGDGPVKTVVIGHNDEDRARQSLRVQQYMNYQYLHEMPGAFEEEDRLMFRLPLRGSMFKKLFFDPHYGTLRAAAIEPTDFVAPYTAASLEVSPRYTHVLRVTGNELKKQMRDGFYRHVEVDETADESDGRTVTHDEIDDIESRYRSARAEDERHTLLEMHLDLDLDGFEDVHDGYRTGVALPYIVTVHLHRQKVLSIRRNWREGDPKKRKRVYFIHKKFSPGFGFYGLGMYHLIGGLSEAATGALRSLLDAAAFANLQGGFRSREAELVGSDEPLSPGEWRETEASPEELKTAFFNIPYKEPSTTLFQLLGYLDEKGQRFANTTDAMVGDTRSATMPVGTTAMLIEQGSKVFSAIHKRLHAANAIEYRLLAELNAEFLPFKYPYDVEGETREVLQSDFDGRVDVIPVSDPNTVSGAQRIAVSQAILELSATRPDLYDAREVHRQMLLALKAPQIEKMLPDGEPLRLDPISENAQLMVGAPIKVFPDQDHAAHLAVHQHWISMLEPEMQTQYMPAYMAHRAEHLANAYRIEIANALGIEIPTGPMDPQIENQIAVAAAQLLQSSGQLPALEPAPDPEMAKAKAQIQREDALAEAQIERDAKMTEIQATRQLAEQARKDEQRENEHQQRMRHTEEEAKLKMAMNVDEADVRRHLDAFNAILKRLEDHTAKMEQAKSTSSS